MTQWIFFLTPGGGGAAETQRRIPKEAQPFSNQSCYRGSGPGGDKGEKAENETERIIVYKKRETAGQTREKGVIFEVVLQTQRFNKDLAAENEAQVLPIRPPGREANTQVSCIN